VYAATVDAGQIYTDQTGCVPVMPSKGNTYIMVLCEYGGNTIMAEPIKNRTSGELLLAFHAVEQNMISGGLNPIFMRLDNEASQLLKDYLYDKNISFQLVPPYCNRRNAAEHVIRSFKDYLIAGLCSTGKKTICICGRECCHKH
jgi:hypothetical protein